MAGEMIERVARALCAPDNPDQLVLPVKTLAVTSDGFAYAMDPIPLWNTKVNSARAAIAAMREPSTNYGIRVVDGGAYRVYDDGRVETIYDAALKEPA